MRNILAARDTTAELKKSLHACAVIWNEACHADGKPEYAFESIPSRRKQLLARMDEVIASLTPDTEVVEASAVMSGDVIYNPRTGEQHKVVTVTLTGNDVILANSGPQVFFSLDEKVTIIRKEPGVCSVLRTEDDMTMAQVKADDLAVGDWVYFLGYYRQVIALRKLNNNVRWYVAGASQLIGKSVLIDVGVNLRRAESVCEGARLVVEGNAVVTVDGIKPDTDNTLLILTDKWCEAYNHTELKVL